MAKTCKKKHIKRHKGVRNPQKRNKKFKKNSREKQRKIGKKNGETKTR